MLVVESTACRAKEGPRRLVPSLGAANLISRGLVMPEWSFVVILGAIAGVITTLFLGGKNIPIPSLIASIENSPFHFWYRLVENVILGMMGSFIAWVANSAASFDQVGITPVQVVGSLGSGGAGSIIVQGLFRQAQDDETISSLGSALKELLERLPTEENP